MCSGKGGIARYHYGDVGHRMSQCQVKDTEIQNVDPTAKSIDSGISTGAS